MKTVFPKCKFYHVDLLKITFGLGFSLLSKCKLRSTFQPSFSISQTPSVSFHFLLFGILISTVFGHHISFICDILSLHHCLISLPWPQAVFICWQGPVILFTEIPISIWNYIFASIAFWLTWFSSKVVSSMEADKLLFLITILFSVPGEWTD